MPEVADFETVRAVEYDDGAICIETTDSVGVDLMLWITPFEARRLLTYLMKALGQYSLMSGD